MADHLDPDFVLRLDRPGPRYTSYPPADRFRRDFTSESASCALAQCNGEPDEPLSVYVHLPHCAKLCGYCACNVVPTKSSARRTSYVDAVLTELSLLDAQLPRRRKLGQFHLGGGTPNSYEIDDLRRLVHAVTQRFLPVPDAEMAIEIDPRQASYAQVAALRSLGLNRISLGVQDFDPVVQHAIGRHQSRIETLSAIDAARAVGFVSVNIDLVYGLPLQTLGGFDQTLETLLELNPDRIALFSFAYLPAQRPNQRRIPASTLPAAPLKVRMLIRARERLMAAGYMAIGMDHFARPGDGLARALESGRLRRNFQGYTVAPGEGPLEVLGLGLSAVGDFGGAYLQNTRDISTYIDALACGRLPIERGLTLSRDDRRRRFVIERLMTRFRLDHDDLARYGVNLERDFSDALSRLAPLMRDGCLQHTPDALELTPLGRLFPRLAAMCFDAVEVGPDSRYSRVV